MQWALPLHGMTTYVLATSGVLDLYGAICLGGKRGGEWLVVGFFLGVLASLRLIALMWPEACVYMLFVCCAYEILTVCVCAYLDMVGLSVWQLVVSVNVFFVLLVGADIMANNKLSTFQTLA